MLQALRVSTVKVQGVWTPTVSLDALSTLGHEFPVRVSHLGCIERAILAEALGGFIHTVDYVWTPEDPFGGH